MNTLIVSDRRPWPVRVIERLDGPLEIALKTLIVLTGAGSLALIGFYAWLEWAL